MKKLHFYKYNPSTFEHIRIKNKSFWLIGLSVFTLISGSFIIGRITVSEEYQIIEESLEYEELIILVDDKENDQASPKRIYEYMKEINIKFPEIVWSQAAVESRFMSPICQENHNFFGMKNAKRRPNVQTGEQYDHATYDNWKMSVIDYSMWQCFTGVVKLETEDQYYSYLDGRYATGEHYVSKVKTIRNDFEYYLNYYEEEYNEKVKLNK